jgi:hypothetical protein
MWFVSNLSRLFLERKETQQWLVGITLNQIKIALTWWVDKALDQALTRKNIILGFKGIGFWPLNPKAMDKKLPLISCTHW